MKKITQEKIIQGTKVIILGLLFSVLIATAAPWQGPSALPPQNNVDAPINAGSVEQTKAGRLNTLGLFRGNGNVIVGGNATTPQDPWNLLNLAVYQPGATPAPLTLNGVIGAGAEILSGGEIVGSLAKTYTPDNGATHPNALLTYPVHVCMDESGLLSVCDTMLVSLTATTTSIAEAVNTLTATSHPVNLTWTVNGAPAGVVCQASAKLVKTAADVSSSVGWTGTKSSSGGTATANINKFGQTQYKLLCDGDGNLATTNDQATDVETVALTGSVQAGQGVGGPLSGTFSTSQFSNVSTYNVMLIGSGGQGGFLNPNLDPYLPATRTSTTFGISGGSIIASANPGTAPSFGAGNQSLLPGVGGTATGPGTTHTGGDGMYGNYSGDPTTGTGCGGFAWPGTGTNCPALNGNNTIPGVGGSGGQISYTNPPGNNIGDPGLLAEPGGGGGGYFNGTIVSTGATYSYTVGSAGCVPEIAASQCPGQGKVIITW